MRTHRLRKDDLRKNFSPLFIVHVRRAFRENFVLLRGVARRLSPITIRRLCRKREGRNRRRRRGKSNAGLRRSDKEEEEEYNRISRGITTSRRLFVRSAFPEISYNRVIVDLFTKGSHHKNLSVILISQNLFHQGRGQRDISLNANYIVVFKNPRDRAQIRHLARQVYPDDPKFLEEAYYDATSRPHGYLLLDLKQSTPDKYRFRTCIFPDDTMHYVYVPRRSFSSGYV